MNADLHTHSYFSDGLLSPTELVRRAHAHGVDLLALTDHDEVAGVPEARLIAEELGVDFLSGVEASVTWGEDVTVHIVGLGIDIANASLCEGLAGVREGRMQRAVQIGDALEKLGIGGAYEGALRHVCNPALLSRSHFARCLIERGYAPDVRTVFDQWLGKGKPAYIRHRWPSLEEVMGWIRAAGGIAIIAHPFRYRISNANLRALVAEFKALGGEAIEVVSGAHTEEQMRDMARLVRDFDLLASRASDFHAPGESRVDVGMIAALPPDLEPVWRRFSGTRP